MNQQNTAELLSAALTILTTPVKRVNLYETACKECCFATYEGTTQTGCRFGRLDKFRQQGVDVVEVMDDDREFFLIKTACLLHRHRKSPWAMKVPGSQRMKVAREEVRLAVDVVVVILDGDTLPMLATTIESLKAQTSQPTTVTVVVNRDGVKPAEVVGLLPDHWNARFIMERAPDGARVRADRCVDHAVVGSKADFYAVFRPGIAVPGDFVQRLDTAINDDLERFVLLEPNHAGQGLVVRMKAHAYYGGNTEAVIQSGQEAGEHADSIVDKIRHRAREEDNGHLIRNVANVCPGMKP